MQKLLSIQLTEAMPVSAAIHPSKLGPAYQETKGCEVEWCDDGMFRFRHKGRQWLISPGRVKWAEVDQGVVESDTPHPRSRSVFSRDETPVQPMPVEEVISRTFGPEQEPNPDGTKRKPGRPRRA